MFVYVLQSTGAFADALREVGYDLARQQPSYPGRVWKASLEVACQHTYPLMPQERAMRELGVRFLEGFFQTLAGKAIALMMPILGPAGVRKRLQRFFTMGSQGTEVQVREVAPREWQVEMQDRYPLADFDAGIVEAVLRRAGVTAQATITERLPHEFVMQVRW